MKSGRSGRGVGTPQISVARALVAAGLLALLTASGAGAVGKERPRAAPGAADQTDARDLLAGATGSDPQREFVPGEVLVRFRSGTGEKARASVFGELDAILKRELPVPGLELARIDPGASVPEAVAELERQPDVRYAEPNFIYRTELTPNDTRFGELWGLHNTAQVVNGMGGTPDADIDAPEAWNTTTGSGAVTLAVVDTGVAYDHPDLAPNIWSNPGESGGGKESNGIDDDGNGLIDDWRGWDYLSKDNDPRDLEGHGTHVAGTIGARGNDGQGVAGVNWQAKLMPLRVCGPNVGCPSSAITSAFAYAGAKGAQVVNASLGGPGFSQAQSDAIANAPNTLFVFAAGNGGSDSIGDNNDATPHYPCDFSPSNIVCVAATTQSDGLASFSNYGAGSVDLGAPGTNILSTWPAYATVFGQGFENALGGTWTSGGTNNTWARTNEAAKTGSFSLTDSHGANYLNNTNSFARPTNSFSLSSQTGCQLDYQLRLATEPGFDFLSVEASTNASTWSTIAQWSGSTAGSFQSFSSDFSGFDGQASVYIRFRLQSDSSVVADGAHIDDVEVRCLTSTYAGDEFRFLNGTSMAAPHVAGTAALLRAQQPGASTAAVKNSLLANVDPSPPLAGNTVTGGRLNADIDLTPPDTVINTGPSGTIATNQATFTFAGDPAGDTAKVQCTVDAAAFADCTSPKTFTGLSDGSHTASFRAEDASGNQDQSPATRTFTVNTKAKISKVKVRGPSKVKKGRKATYKVKITNSGNARANGVKLKVKGRGVKAKKAVGKIPAGKSRTVKVKLRFKKRGKVKVSFKVTSTNAGSKTARKKIKVKG